MNSNQLVDCPEASVLPLGNPPNPFAYGINYHPLQAVTTAYASRSLTGYMGMNGSQVEAPADTVAFGDGGRINNGTLVRVGFLFRPSYAYSSAKYSSVHGRHNGIANVNWMDGHAKGAKVSFPNTQPNGIAGAKVNFGDLVSPAYPYDSCAATYGTGLCNEDYYFNPSKPSN